MIKLNKPTPCLICGQYMPKGTGVEMVTINKQKKYFHCFCYNRLPKRGSNT